MDSPGWTGFQVSANHYNVNFLVPGTQTMGKVKGFGAVFANVAPPFTTAIEPDTPATACSSAASPLR